MTDYKAMTDAYERYRKALAKATEHNKTVVLDALAAAGITSVTVEFDGEGDSGQIESVIACAGETPVEVPAVPVTLLRASTQKDTDSPFPSERPLSEAIETLCYDFLEERHGGWENNEGAFGSFVFDVAGRSIDLKFNGRFTDVATHNYSF